MNEPTFSYQQISIQRISNRLKILLGPLIYNVDTNSEKKVYFVLCTPRSDNTFHSALKNGKKQRQFIASEAICILDKICTFLAFKGIGAFLAVMNFV